MLKELLTGVIGQNEVLNHYNANITYIKLPKGIYGFVFNYKGINNIVIASHLSYYLKKKVIIHELAHIELNQLNQADSDLFAFYIDKYEDEANDYLKQLIID